ncbi:MAG: biotin--[acetyl-CoA-carboxylase] ligase [Candidatus Nitrosopumilus limneticus]|nr:Biotin-protein ligase / Biotin operon repressor [Candidatus Nitrosopumilus limneticus]MDC4212307.1 biotin--[acetyl-CoA-carboxylase] ligase [Candidatus Nitrosopumilus limneticus]MDC4215184.1 biotin--[acetyl-CoA-carboxylase] ligase [Candidatus Nitrosopumilus limneticus]MDC4215893.1 biotin--[acetyl-CoA-carboxylase] ligase [Candidatus Nitrosopumilus limneticus]MDC4217326.1 biotin--[acetyl-CoA-carboxylase] ligase [Candidatus Nitrosopumilus limneticus]
MIYNSFNDTGLLKVLKFLKSHNTEYLSGQDLSDVLRISRVAVWKHIKKIRTLGYTVESKQKEGYKITKNSDLLLPWEIIAGLETKVLGQRAYYFDIIDSTQNQALKMNNENDGTIIIAEKQTGGRGRSGRKWISPKGGIWFSLILHPKFDISNTTLFPIASSLALSYAIEKTCKISPELKWPNDLTIKGKKLAGMLVDASFESNKIENLVLGVGINFEINSKEIEKILKKTPNFYGVTSLSEQKNKIKPIKLIQSFLLELEKIYEDLNRNQTNKIIVEWTKRSSTIGKKIEIDTEQGKVKGEAVKIDDDGGLIVKDKDKNRKIFAGDIVHLTK